MFSHLQRANLLRYIHSMQVFYILVLTGLIYSRIYDCAYLKKTLQHCYPPLPLVKLFLVTFL